MASDLYHSALVEQATRVLLRRKVLAALSEHQYKLAASLTRKLAAHCGRRSGKSHSIAAKFFLTAIDNPGGVSVFIAISAARAYEIIGRAFTVLGKKIGWLPRATTRSGQLYFVFPNGHRVWVAGCKNRADAEKFRGDPYCGVGIDECDSLRGHLQYLVEEAVMPTLMDFDGWIVLTGTPGATPAGYFWEVTTGGGTRSKWETYQWTCLDNPFLRNPREWLTNHLLELGLDESSPGAQREWFGNWVKDLDALIYAWDSLRNGVHEPLGAWQYQPWRYVVGVDLGVVDATAAVVGAYEPGVPDLHLLESMQWAGLSPSGAYARLMELKCRYPGARFVADLGGQGKAFAQEWANTFNFHVESATKMDMLGQVAFVNGALRGGTCKVHLPGCRELVDEWSILPWDEKRKGADPGYANHLSDAGRYCIIGMSPNYKAEVLPPEVGTPEWERQESERERREAFARARRKLKGGRAA